MKTFILHEPGDYLALFMRRKWWILLSAVPLLAVVCIVTLLLPKMYLSETLVLVEPRDVPNDVVKDFITWDTQERLIAIQERVLSRTNLLTILKEKQFSEGLERQFRGLGEKGRVERLRRRINVEVTTTRGNRGASVVPFFKISYQDWDPALAQAIAERLVALFISSDADTRTTQVFGTADFLETEVNRVAGELADAEEQLAQVKERFRYELPDQMDPNLRTLDRLQEQLKANTEEHDRYLSMKLDLERQISETPSVIAREVSGSSSSPSPGRSQTSPLVQQYREKELLLNELTSKYTEKHPDVLRLKAELEGLKKEIPPEDLVELEPAVGTKSTVINEANPVYQKLTSQLAQVNTELNILRERGKYIDNELRKYTRRVENTPRREQDIVALERRYQSLQEQYEGLKQKLNDAQLAQSLESRQKGEQFKVIDPASLPLAPAKPNRLLVLLAGAAGALGFGLLLAFAVDLWDQKIWTSEEIKELLGITVLAEIPEIISEQAIKVSKHKAMVRSVLFALLCLACGLAIYLTYSTPQLRFLGTETLANLLGW